MERQKKAHETWLAANFGKAQIALVAVCNCVLQPFRT